MAYIGSKPANKPVVASDIDPTVITGQTALAVAPADTDEFLISDAGTLKRLDYSYIKDSGGITVADQWRLTTTFQNDADPIASNLEQVDTGGQGTIGTAMTQSSGVFTFPSTGMYLVRFIAVFSTDQTDDSPKNKITIKCTTDNSSYADIAFGNGGLPLVDSTFTAMQAVAESIVDVTDTSNVKVKFSIDVGHTSVYTSGNSTRNETCMTFIRLGDT